MATPAKRCININAVWTNIQRLQRLRHDARWGASKMIVLSCSTSDEDRARSREYGADRFLSKPLRMENVLEIISSLG